MSRTRSKTLKNGQLRNVILCGNFPPAEAQKVKRAAKGLHLSVSKFLRFVVTYYFNASVKKGGSDV